MPTLEELIAEETRREAIATRGGLSEVVVEAARKHRQAQRAYQAIAGDTWRPVNVGQPDICLVDPYTREADRLAGIADRLRRELTAAVDRLLAFEAQQMPAR